MALVHDHIGRVIHCTATDWGGTVIGVLGPLWQIVFGVPATSESDAWRAVHGAHDIRERLATGGVPVSAAISVNTGKALVRQQGTLSGAPISVTGAVIDQALGRLTALPAGELSICETTARITEAGDLPGTETAPFVGRERDLTMLRQWWWQVRRLGQPHLATVLASAGMGKTRLIREFERRLSEDSPGLRFLVGRAGPRYSAQSGLTALRDVVRAHCGIDAADDDGTVERKLAAAVAELPGRVDWVLNHLRGLIFDGSDTSEDAVSAWSRFLEEMAVGRPTLLVIEDLQHADDAVLDTVDMLAKYTSQVPLLTVVTARPELLDRRPGWGGGKLHASTTVLQPLEDVEVRQLAAGLGGMTEAEIDDCVVAKADGNPLFAIELATTFADDASRHPLPRSVRGIVGSQIDLLPAAVKSVLLDAAVLGDIVCDTAIAAMGEISLHEAEGGLRYLERQEFLTRTGSTVEGRPEYRFRGGVIRDVANERLVTSVLMEKHRRAAEWLSRLRESSTAHGDEPVRRTP
ncbi:AAA family ATPase [Streptomyces sp. 8L]|uniref:AAA family ATPase n=1 Tax=Streptomyces sp. 8L TaxID=2877242 RepID=UPI001CD1C620|nr:AAA family ATPase [Streptomyces sp. 8L]MCA1220285.1 AAA family ATPase [Streptomyces sp. 8L]